MKSIKMTDTDNSAYLYLHSHGFPWCLIKHGPNHGNKRHQNHISAFITNHFLQNMKTYRLHWSPNGPSNVGPWVAGGYMVRIWRPGDRISAALLVSRRLLVYRQRNRAPLTDPYMASKKRPTGTWYCSYCKCLIILCWTSNWSEEGLSYFSYQENNPKLWNI